FQNILTGGGRECHAETSCSEHFDSDFVTGQYRGLFCISISIAFPCVSIPSNKNDSATGTMELARNKKVGSTAAAVCRGVTRLFVPAMKERLNGPMILPKPLAAWPNPDARAPRLTPYLSTVYGARLAKPPSTQKFATHRKTIMRGSPATNSLF